jgi:hypothetical protein
MDVSSTDKYGMNLSEAGILESALLLAIDQKTAEALRERPRQTQLCSPRAFSH